MENLHEFPTIFSCRACTSYAEVDINIDVNHLKLLVDGIGYYILTHDKKKLQENMCKLSDSTSFILSCSFHFIQPVIGRCVAKYSTRLATTTGPCASPKLGKCTGTARVYAAVATR